MKKLNFKIAFGLIFAVPLYIVGVVLFFIGMILFWSIVRIISFLGILDATEYLLYKTKSRLVQSELEKVLKKEKELK